jgi:putative tricarboxylic transport membrane protein
MKKYGDFILGLIGVLIATGIFGMSVQIGRMEGQTIGADFLPKIVSIILLICSLFTAINGWKQSRSYVEKTAEYSSNGKGILTMIVVMLIYAYVLKPIGFIPATIVFVFIAISLMTKKTETSYPKIALISVISVVAIYLIFTQLFGIRLPQGILRGII